MRLIISTNRECETDHQSVVEPVVEAELAPVQETVVQVEGEDQIDGRLVVGVLRDGAKMFERMLYVGERSIDDSGIMRCVNGIVDALEAEVREQEICNGKGADTEADGDDVQPH